ncbi:LCP family protein [Paenibacillus gorillae]|uniref:LCP family protein n=1 Tax=Paenibacillus gorillae TaxID=1243662 RepID=UPI0004AFD60F|nr:LCP family protein [Paenibacillus gorillae]
MKANEAIQSIAAPKPVDAPDNYVKKDSFEPITFLLAGVDSRDGGDGMMNADVLMLVSMNPQTHSASMLSLPRDLLLKPSGLPSRKANYYYAHFYLKDKEQVIPNTKQFFSDLTGFPLDYMVVVNFDALRQTVDALGGLQIDVDMDMKYRDTVDGTNIDLKKGLQTLDGQQVLDFVRYRKSNRGTQESSDFARNDRQQQVIKQIIEKLGNFQGISQWGKVLEIIGDNVKSDIPGPELQQWIYSFNKIKPNQIHTLQMDSVWRSPFVYVKKEDLQQALLDLGKEAELQSEIKFKENNFGLMN